MPLKDKTGSYKTRVLNRANKSPVWAGEAKSRGSSQNGETDPKRVSGFTMPAFGAHVNSGRFHFPLLTYGYLRSGTAPRRPRLSSDVQRAEAVAIMPDAPLGAIGREGP